MGASPARWTVPILAVAFLLSGAAGLIHEVVWARLMGHLFGATSLAISTVPAAYMGGLALGSYWIGRRTARLKSRPRAYALMEIGIGAFALVIPLLLATFQSVYPEVLIFRSRGTDCILVGSRRPLKINLAELDRRWAGPAVAAENARVGIDRPEDLLASLYTGPDDVRAIVAGATIHTDDNMYVEFHASREMIGKLNVATRQIFGLLERTPAESVLADPRALLSSSEWLRGLVAALTRMKRDATRYEGLLAKLD